MLGFRALPWHVRVEGVALVLLVDVGLHALEDVADRLALRLRERVARHIDDAVGHALAREEERHLVAEVVAVVRQQVVRLGREARARRLLAYSP